jgi:photosystem II stability/assembly factor-like uncharacterized protein
MKSLLFIITILISIRVSAQWIQTPGPNEAAIESFIANGTTIFAGTNGNGGIYKSTDSGLNWVLSNTGLEKKYSVFSFCMLGSNIIAGTSNEIYLSSNNGALWQNITPANNSADVKALAYDGTYLYAALNGVGVARSSNQGAIWSINTGITDKTIFAMLAANNKIFIATNTSGILASSDRGVNWQEANIGITNKNSFRSFTTIGTDIYTCSYGSGIYKSVDNGVTWVAVNNGLSSNNARKIYAHGSNLYVSVDGGIFKSTDNAGNWVYTNNGINALYSNNFISSGSNLFVAVSGRGIYKTTNNGDLWTSANNGITNSTIKTFVKSGSFLIAGAYYSGGVHFTNNGGSNWNASYPTMNYIVQLINNENAIYAATWGGGIFKTTDNGQTWAQLNSGLPNLNVFSVAINGSRIFAGTNTSGVFISENNGLSWQEINTGLTNKNINMLTLAGNNLCAATTGGVFISTNNGISWAPAGLTGKNVITLKENNNKLYAGTWGDGVYVSADNGTAWTQLKNGMTNLFIYAITFDNNNNIYASSGANVYSSMDGGVNWNLKNEGLPFDAYSLEVMDNYLYAGTSTFGVWKRPLSELLTSVEDEDPLPSEFFLEQNYPNPFNPQTKISFKIPDKSFINLSIYDIQGNMIRTLIKGEYFPGSYSVDFDGSGLSSGVYFYQLKSLSGTLTKKMLLIK